MGQISYFASFFNDFDAIITPSAPGEAPLFSAGKHGQSDFFYCLDIMWATLFEHACSHVGK